MSCFTNLLSRFHQPSGFGWDVLHSGVKSLPIPLYRAIVPLSCPSLCNYFLCTLSYIGPMHRSRSKKLSVASPAKIVRISQDQRKPLFAMSRFDVKIRGYCPYCEFGKIETYDMYCSLPSERPPSFIRPPLFFHIEKILVS